MQLFSKTHSLPFRVTCSMQILILEELDLGVCVYGTGREKAVDAGH